MKVTLQLVFGVVLVFLNQLVVAGPVTSFLSGALNADNQHLTQLFKRTDTGDQFILNVTSADLTTSTVIPGWGLEQDADYRIRIEVTDFHDIAGLIAEFNISGVDHVFATNGATHLVSNDYDSAWQELLTGNQAFSYGTKTADPWFSIGYDDHLYGPTANWIWHTHSHNQDFAVFVIDIDSTYVVATPATLLLLLGFAAYLLWPLRRA